MTETSPKLERALSDIQRRWVPDTRLGVFEVRVVDQRLSGLTTNRDAVTALRALATDFHLTCEVAVIPAVGTEPDAIVTVALAPLLRGPRVSEARVSDALHGERLTVLERNGDWLRVRAGDGYVAWIHAGYVATGTSEWADDWIGRATLHSLGAALEVNGEPVRLPHGPRGGIARRARAGGPRTGSGAPRCPPSARLSRSRASRCGCRTEREWRRDAKVRSSWPTAGRHSSAGAGGAPKPSCVLRPGSPHP